MHFSRHGRAGCRCCRSRDPDAKIEDNQSGGEGGSWSVSSPQRRPVGNPEQRLAIGERARGSSRTSLTEPRDRWIGSWTSGRR